MTIKSFITMLTIALSTLTLSACSSTQSSIAAATDKGVKIQQIRNATVKITYGDTTFLVDPMLSDKGTYPGFEGTYRSELRNPLVDLPLAIDTILEDVDAVVVTHTHLDHWDDAAQQLLPKDIPLYAQHQGDASLIRSQGFTNVHVISDKVQFEGITLNKTGGQHGTNEMYAIPELGAFLGDAMGVVFQASGYKTTYLVGDTVWRDEVDYALEQYKPNIIILNAGNAMLDGFDHSIIMGKEDALKATQVAPHATIIASHLDAINHMSQTRQELRQYVQEHNIEQHVEIPEDGELLSF